MKKLSKMVTSVAVASVLANGVFAEESGVFVGLEAGASIMNTKSETTDFKDSKYGFGGNYGFIVGYKQFFNPHIGLRYYANINYMQADVYASIAPDISQDGIIYNTSRADTINFMLVNYAVNVDFLGNFIAKENVDFGGFVGIGLGGNTYLLDQNIVSKTSETQRKIIAGQVAITTFNAALNIGLRSNIFKNHGIELVAKVPFIGQKFVDTTRADGAPLKMTRTYYSVALRYTYSF
ncbi:outer membrane beta-barrel protein [Helicobacter sp. T3_23-1059]